MEENKNIPGTEPEESEIEIVTLLDEDDNEIRFELIGGYTEKEVQYYALIPEGSADEDGGFSEYIILKAVVDADGNEDLVEIEDDAEFERIAAVFDDAFNAEFDYDE
jgi:uncharacterized protein YrzB (UPF0473 family)